MLLEFLPQEFQASLWASGCQHRHKRAEPETCTQHVASSHYDLLQLHADLAHPPYGNRHIKIVTQPGRLKEIERDGAYCKHQSFCIRQPGNIDPTRPQPFGAGTFHKFKVITVINNPTCIGVFVVNPNGPAEMLSHCLLVRQANMIRGSLRFQPHIRHNVCHQRDQFLQISCHLLNPAAQTTHPDPNPGLVL